MVNKLIHLGIDWEDFALAFYDKGFLKSYKEFSNDFVYETRYLLDLLEREKIHCTFFCNGRTAEIYPNLLKEISNNGHHIASHGYLHKHRENFSEDQFLDDCIKSKQKLEEITLKKVKGYRSPYLSFNKKNYISSLKLLIKAGYTFDSSITFSTLKKIKISNSKLLKELSKNLSIKPLLSIDFLNKGFNLAGGSIWRMVPSSLILWIIKYFFAPETFSLYFHPYEFGRTLNPERALGKNVSKTKKILCFLRWNLGRKKIENLIIRLNKLENVKFDIYKEGKDI